MATASSVTDDLQPLKRSSSNEWLPPYMSELRVVLLGNSWSERSSVGNIILGETKFNTEEEPDSCLKEKRQFKDKEIVLINTPDLLHPNISEDKLTEHVENCVRLSAPGPHVFLLVLQPEDFTEEHKLRLCRVLKLFSDESFDHSLVLISPPREKSSALTVKYVPDQHLKDMIKNCRYRYLKLKNVELPELLTRLGQTAKENNGEHVSCDILEDEDAGLVMTPKFEHNKPVLNLVLCGRRGAGKTSAAKVILGQTEVHSEWVKHQGEVCGRWVSLVELPALYGKPQEEVMKKSFRCVSLCDPEGVHAFILVLPVVPLTDEDKEELKTIQNTFSSRVNDFTMILFTVESDPTAPDVVNFVNQDKDIQELCQSCGGRYFVLNTKDQEQIQELLDAVEKMRFEGSRCFTKDMFTMAQMEKVVEQENTNARLKGELFDNTEKSTQIQVERILKEKEEEMTRKEEDLRRKHEEDLEALKKKFKEQSVEIDQERKLRAKQLKDKDEVLNKEREERKKEQEEEVRRRKKQEETQRQELKRNLEASEKIIQLEREQKENAEKKLELFRKEMKRDRDAWDKERKDIWEQRHQEDKQSLEEEKSSLRKLQDEYYRKRRKWTYSLFVLLLFLLFLVYYLFLSYAYTHTTESAKTKEHT